MRNRPFEDRMALTLQATTLVAVVAAAIGVLAPGRVGEGFGVAVVVLLVAVPVARVAALVAHWYVGGDKRFVAIGLALVTLVGLGALVAALG